VLLNRLQAHRFFTQSIRAMQVGAGVGIIDLSPYAPTQMPVSTHLGSDFLILSVRQIDVLTTLTSNLAMSREQLSGIGSMARPLGMLEATMLRDVARHELELVAQAFEVFAPQRKIALPGAEPIFASALARSEADGAAG
jgi:hypothetical protein